MSAFEIGQKHARGKLELSLPPSEWFPLALKLHGIHEARFDCGIALRATALPDLHRDPYDRFLIATAQALGCTLLTPDPLIRAYPDLQTAW
jgi:PIN domain nuclease of toxin-antitoxin system